ncbi:MAG: penicillin-binding protein, partial [Myxococcales bacterium]|nr:penicillin-binding protein [Myxococcales bacterium]
FATFANGGTRAIPYSITRVESRSGEVLETVEPTTVEAISPQVAYLMTSLLTGVINEGTGRRARELGRPLAGKTGTTNESQDAWFVGYSPDIVVTTWVGYDKDRALNSRETGAKAALPIWMDFMRVALDGTPIEPFKVPEKIVFRKIDAETGLLPGTGTKQTRVEAFMEGTEPAERTGWRGSSWRPTDGIAPTGTRMLFGDPE